MTKPRITHAYTMPVQARPVQVANDVVASSLWWFAGHQTYVFPCTRMGEWRAAKK